MELKRRLGLAAELGLVMITLPLLLLGCGGGGSGSSSASPGIMTGQFWTDLTGAGITEFWPGIPPVNLVNSPAGASIYTATFSGSSYVLTDTLKAMSGVAWTTVPDNSYYLVGTAGWTAYPNPETATAANASTFTFADVSLGTARVTISTTNLSGTTIVASSMVPAIDTLGYASSVSPTSAIYPAGSYAYALSSLNTTTTTQYWIYADPNNEVTTVASSPTPINPANFTAAKFTLHATTADPICMGGYGLIYKTGTTYDFYALRLNAGVPTGTMPTCQTASITTSSLGTYDLSFVSIMGTPVVTFSNPTSVFQTTDIFGNFVLGELPMFNKAYFGNITPAGTTTSTSYWLNKTAMDAAMNAWGATSPN